MNLHPISCLHDEPVTIRVKGLEPNEPVTLSAIIHDSKDVCFCSFSHYL